MQKLSLDALARELLDRASRESAGRAAETVAGGHEKTLRQTVIAMREGTSLAEHENPGEATILVLTGRVRLVADEASWDGRDGDLLLVPDERHSVEAISDAAILLTAVSRR